ncbi:MAG TPA: PilT/PilU family type 4a pilus ATPase, partial [Actinomycetota bacterium]|nr:PilT/PilU family type 4a pilus ATPase [Actinomycetota bacterium]
MDVRELLRYTVEQGASDLHLKAGNVPFIRVDGELQPTSFPKLSPGDTEFAADQLMPEHKKREFLANNESDLGHTEPGIGRFRINVYRQRGVVGLALRRVRSDIPTFEELRLPPVMRTLADSARGLILITGPTGTGKTTTIAAMIGHINNTRRAHIVTIEDPIEVVHEDSLSLIQQREIGLDTDSYGSALKHVIRQDPDVIFVGEIRDQATAETAAQASLTGHLVLATVHANDAVGSVRRFLDLGLDAATISETLRGALAQRLLRTLCTDCAQPIEGDLSPEEAVLAKRFGAQPVMRAAGCDQCGGSGYRGRRHVVEMILPTQELLKMVAAEAAHMDLMVRAREDGMRSMLEGALDLVAEGLTTLAEVERVIGEEAAGASATSEPVAQPTSPSPAPPHEEPTPPQAAPPAPEPAPPQAAAPPPQPA